MTTSTSGPVPRRRGRRGGGEREHPATLRSALDTLSAYMGALPELSDFRWMDLPDSVQRVARDSGDRIADHALQLALRRCADPKLCLHEARAELGEGLGAHLAAALLVDIGLRPLVESGAVFRWRLNGVESVLGAHLVAIAAGEHLGRVGRRPEVELVGGTGVEPDVEIVLARAEGYLTTALERRQATRRGPLAWVTRRQREP